MPKPGASLEASSPTNDHDWRCTWSPKKSCCKWNIYDVVCRMGYLMEWVAAGMRSSTPIDGCVGGKNFVTLIKDTSMLSPFTF